MLPEGRKPDSLDVTRQRERSDSVVNAIKPKFDDVNTTPEHLMDIVGKLEIAPIGVTNDKLPEDFRNPNILIHTEQMKRSGHHHHRECSDWKILQ